MQNDPLTALLLDPFLTYEEAVKQARATPAVSGLPRLVSPKAAAPSHLPGAVRRPARIKVPGVPAIHHPPATAG